MIIIAVIPTLFTTIVARSFFGFFVVLFLIFCSVFVIAVALEWWRRSSISVMKIPLLLSLEVVIIAASWDSIAYSLKLKTISDSQLGDVLQVYFLLVLIFYALAWLIKRGRQKSI